MAVFHGYTVIWHGSCKIISVPADLISYRADGLGRQAVAVRLLIFHSALRTGKSYRFFRLMHVAQRFPDIFQPVILCLIVHIFHSQGIPFLCRLINIGNGDRLVRHHALVLKASVKGTGEGTDQISINITCCVPGINPRVHTLVPVFRHRPSGNRLLRVAAACLIGRDNGSSHSLMAYRKLRLRSRVAVVHPVAVTHRGILPRHLPFKLPACSVKYPDRDTGSAEIVRLWRRS